MIVGFSTEQLAGVCNSKTRLAECWTPLIGTAVGRRLHELGACATPAIARTLPGTTVIKKSDGTYRIRFRSDRFTITISATYAAPTPDDPAGEGILCISKLNIKEGTAS
jgi:hypothetical protein